MEKLKYFHGISGYDRLFQGKSGSNIPLVGPCGSDQFRDQVFKCLIALNDFVQISDCFNLDLGFLPASFIQVLSENTF